VRGAGGDAGAGEGRNTAGRHRVTEAVPTMTQTGCYRKPNLGGVGTGHEAALINVERAVMDVIC
jgi:hypothetical protein